MVLTLSFGFRKSLVPGQDIVKNLRMELADLPRLIGGSSGVQTKWGSALSLPSH